MAFSACEHYVLLGRTRELLALYSTIGISKAGVRIDRHVVRCQHLSIGKLPHLAPKSSG
jgi:hypothetical protein